MLIFDIFCIYLFINWFVSAVYLLFCRIVFDFLTLLGVLWKRHPAVTNSVPKIQRVL